MTTVRIVRGHDPRRLLEAAASDFLVRRRATPDAPFPTPGTWLAVRQGGIRDDLLRLAHERGVPGWFDPPLSVFAELPKLLFEDKRRSLDDFERLVVLRSLLSSMFPAPVVFGGHLGNDYLEQLDRVFGELIGEGITADAMRAAVIADGTFEARRDEEIARLYGAYLTVLESASVSDPRARLVDCAHHISANPDSVRTAFGGRRALHLLGLADLRGGWRTLLAALAQSPHLDAIAIYTSADLALAPLEFEVQQLEEPDTLASAVFSGRPVDHSPIALISAPDVIREAEEVARRVRELIDAGTPPHRIAVVSRQARPNVDRVCDALNRFGVPASARQRFAYIEVPLVRGILAFLDAAAEGWTRHGLVRLARQPYIGAGLDSHVLNFIGYRERVAGLDQWATSLQSLEDRARTRLEKQKAGELTEEDRRTRMPDLASISAARAAFDRFATVAHELDTPKPLGGWLAWFHSFLGEDPLGLEQRIYEVPDDRFRLARVDLRAWGAIRQLTEAWKDSLERWEINGGPLAIAEFAAQAREMLDADLAIWTETLRGVQVLESLSASYRSFDHLFLTGMASGRFPARPSRSAIWDDADRQRLIGHGLPLEGHGAWIERERDLFRSLLAAAPQITLSYARTGERDSEAIPSAYVDALRACCSVADSPVPSSRVLTPGLPLHSHLDAPTHAARVARMERSRAASVRNEYNGVVSDPELLAWLAQALGDDKVWSPTQLESYAKCPWAYMASRLMKLEEFSEPDEDMEATTRGTIIHETLRLFFQSIAEVTGTPVYLKSEHLTAVDSHLPAALDRALAEIGQREWLGAPGLRAARRTQLLRTLRRFIEHEIETHVSTSNNRTKASKSLQLGVIEHEKGFKDIVLLRNGVRFLFRGSIDRVERGVDHRVRGSEAYLGAVDYKHSIYSTPGAGDKAAWDDRVVLQVPLYAYALSQLYPESRVARTEYVAVKTCKTTHTVETVTVDAKKGAIVENPDGQVQLDRALDAVAEHVKAARAGQFPAAPADSCKCPDFCPGINICRVAGGPQSLFNF